MSPELDPDLNEAIEQESRRILARMQAEQHLPAATCFHAQLNLDLGSTLILISQLQLALRHPSNIGSSSEIARKLVDGLIQRIEDDGLPGFAELARMGDVPEFDV